MIVFGPIPSRRLGKSLGVNNIPPKHCSYSCVYCQIGRTTNMTVKRQEFYSVDYIVSEVEKKLKELEKINVRPDYITFVPDGEPTLDINLKKEAEGLKKFGIKLAIISNSSLIEYDEVKDALMLFDFVSLKIDSVIKDVWYKVDRPHRGINFEKMLEGIKKFSRLYNGFLVTETMLVDNVNDDEYSIKETAEFIKEVSPRKAYILTPTRPPAESSVKSTSNEKLIKAWEIFTGLGINSEIISGYEGNDFVSSGDIEKDILSITSVHPVREDALIKMIKDKNEDVSIIEKLIKENKVKVVFFNNTRYYIRIFN